MYQFFNKTNNFDFFGPNLPKNGFWDQNFKNLSLDLESASLRCYVHQFSDKFAQKWILGSEFQKSKSGFGIRINNLRYQVYQFSDKTDNFEFSGPNLPKNEFWGRNFKKLSLDSESTLQNTMCANFQSKWTTF